MAAIAKTIISEQEYLTTERAAAFKSEYYRGEVFAMAGATKEHNRIVGSLILAVGKFLENKKCIFYPSDLRVFNPLNTLYTYPDVTIVCEKEEYLDDETDTLLNPTVIFEVLSPSTENYDRGTKFKLYRSIPSLKNYVMVSSMEYAVEVYSREDNDTWRLTTAKGKDGAVFISAIDFKLPLEEVYAQVDNLQ